MLSGNFGMAQMGQQYGQMGQQQQYGQPAAPQFQGGNTNQYYPPSITNSGYGQNPQQNNYGAPMSQKPTSYGGQPQQQAPTMPAASSQGASLGLGADGTSGILEPPVTQLDGTHQQIANVRSDVLGKIIGKAGVNITLIKTKSGRAFVILVLLLK
jgi:hypothetical protein